jgi:hypothetical protein
MLSSLAGGNVLSWDDPVLRAGGRNPALVDSSLIEHRRLYKSSMYFASRARE